MELNPETLQAEQQIVEAGLTLGELNLHCHRVIEWNCGSEGTISIETGHLRFEKGRGVVKIEEATCSLCEILGYNDGRWHEVTPREV